MPDEVFGRDAELRAIAAFLDGLPARPGALVLAGPAGAGKTTLLRAGVAAAAGRGCTVLHTMPARSDLRLAFAGLSDLIERCLPEVIGELPPPQARALRVALLLEDAPPQPPEPRLIAAAFRTAVTALAASATVLLVVDDVQWLDPASEAALGFALRRLEQEPVGLLCALRTQAPGTEGPGAELPLELARARLPAGLLPAGGLSRGALHRMLRASLGLTFSHPTLRRIEAESGGNPFIALEIGRALARRGITSVGSAALPVPGTLSGLVSERIGDLAPAVLEAVRLVAVLPDAPAGQYLAGGAGAAELDAAVLAGVLTADAGKLRLAHPLLASAVAGSIPPGRLRELHAAAARLAGSREERVRHEALASAGRSAAVAADLDAVAAAAADRGAPATAAELFGLAAGLTPASQPEAARRRRLNAAAQLALAGETRAATQALEDLMTVTPPGPERADMLRALGKLREDDLALATSLLEQALAEAGQDHRRTAEARLALSHLWLMRGDAGRATAQARAALPHAEASGSAALLATALAQTFDLGLMHGERADESLLARALEIEREAGWLVSGTPPTWFAGVWHILEGRLDAAERELTEVLSRAEADGVEYWQAEALLRLAHVASRGGDAGKAVALAARSLEIAEQLDLPHLLCAALHSYGCAALLAGDAELASTLAARGAELAQRTGDPPYAVLHQGLLGSIDLATGDYPAAAARLRALSSRLVVLGVRPTTQAIRADTIEALVAVGDLDAAAEQAGELEQAVREPVTAALAARYRGLLAAARGDPQAGLAELAEALARHDQVSPMPPERGRTLLVLGELQRRLNQRAAARATLSQALAEFQGCGARLWAARAAAALARISGRAPDPGDLTATERRVAELVTRGLSNRAVAAELFVTVRAVESTLTKAYAKLGVRSRTELAARLRGG